MKFRRRLDTFIVHHGLSNREQTWQKYLTHGVCFRTVLLAFTGLHVSSDHSDMGRMYASAARAAQGKHAMEPPLLSANCLCYWIRWVKDFAFTILLGPWSRVFLFQWRLDCSSPRKWYLMSSPSLWQLTVMPWGRWGNVFIWMTSCSICQQRVLRSQPQDNRLFYAKGATP